MKGKVVLSLIVVVLLMGLAAAGSIISASIGSVEVTSNAAYAQTLPIDLGNAILDPGEVYMTEGTGSISHNLNNANTYAIVSMTGDTSFASAITGAFYYTDTNFDWQYLEGDMLGDGIRVNDLPANSDYRFGMSITNGYNEVSSDNDIGIEITFYAVQN